MLELVLGTFCGLPFHSWPGRMGLDLVCEGGIGKVEVRQVRAERSQVVT